MLLLAFWESQQTFIGAVWICLLAGASELREANSTADPIHL